MGNTSGNFILEVPKDRYWGIRFMKEETDHRVAKCERMLSSLRELWKMRNLPSKIKMKLFDMYSFQLFCSDMKCGFQILLKVKQLPGIFEVKRNNRMKM